MAFVRYTTKDRRRFRDLYEGMKLSLRQLSAVMGISYQTAHRWAKELQVARSPGEGKRLRGTDRRRVERMRRACSLYVVDGLTMARVAEIMGVDRTTIGRWLRSEHNPYYKQANSRTPDRIAATVAVSRAACAAEANANGTRQGPPPSAGCRA